MDCKLCFILMLSCISLAFGDEFEANKSSCSLDELVKLKAACPDLPMLYRKDVNAWLPAECKYRFIQHLQEDFAQLTKEETDELEAAFGAFTKKMHLYVRLNELIPPLAIYMQRKSSYFAPNAQYRLTFSQVIGDLCFSVRAKLARSFQVYEKLFDPISLTELSEHAFKLMIPSRICQVILSDMISIADETQQVMLKNSHPYT